jgi:hypothetical protein
MPAVTWLFKRSDPMWCDLDTIIAVTMALLVVMMVVSTITAPVVNESRSKDEVIDTLTPTGHKEKQ